MFGRLLPVILSCLLLAAHFSRGGILILSLACLVLPGLLLARVAWVPRVFQVILVLGGLEWIRRTWVLRAQRIEAGEDWVRMAVILGAVAMFTFVSALVFQNRKVRGWYGAGAAMPGERGEA
jgi:hypothetical protein